MMNNTELNNRSNFIRNIIDNNLTENQNDAQVVTRFPPEPNGYLHIGHAKSICLNFGIALDYAGGKCNLRFDDTNPTKESLEYVKAIQEDIQWLGFEWDQDVKYASNYFEQLYGYAVELIKSGKAYVCDLTPEQTREYRGTLTQSGRNSPGRDLCIAENLELFDRMRNGDFNDGAMVLRLKIDMASPNINLRDPIIYRVKRAEHHQTGDKWCIYPMYDFTHCLSDAIEGITYSLCTMEFEDHRPLYNWVLDNVSLDTRPQQIEFARLNLSHTVTSKRKLKRLVDDEIVTGWDDPRMPTIAGLRRRGYTPDSIRNFCEKIGVTKSEGVVDVAMLVHSIREDLESKAPRAMCVLNPLKIEITNYPENKTEQLYAPRHPDNEAMGQRQLPFSKELYIEQDDFMEDAPKKFFRLTPGKEVRLRNSYVIRCDEVVKNTDGEIEKLLCSYDDQTLGVNPQGRKVKGVIHWVSASQAINCEVRLYEHLFDCERPDGDELNEHLNKSSLKILTNCKAEPEIVMANAEQRFQFERLGYFCVDRYDSTKSKPVFNRTVALRDTWAKIKKKS